MNHEKYYCFAQLEWLIIPDDITWMRPTYAQSLVWFDIIIAFAIQPGLKQIHNIGKWLEEMF